MANQALYLKWRPQTFDDMIGQEHITATLRNALRQGRIRHAYLFSGPRGTGKTTSARLLAKAVNCQHEDIDQRPCNVCHNCQAVANGVFFDLIEIDAASHTGVDDVRDLRDKITFSPSEGQYKVYIIDEVHRFSGAAFDALLKTLEEPPAHAIFVLATTEIDKVPATIKSRCLLFEFRRVSLREVVERLQMICDDEKISIEPAALELIARQGTGSVRDSISLLDQIIVDPDQQVTLDYAQQMLGAVGGRAVAELVQAVIDNDTANALYILNEAVDMGADPRQFGHQVVDHLRLVMLVQVGGEDAVDATDEMRQILADQAYKISRRRLLKAISSFNGAVNDLRGGWQPQLPLELAIVESTQPLQETAEVEYVEAPPPQPRARKQKSSDALDSAETSSASLAKGDSSGVQLQAIIKDWSSIKKAAEIRRTSLPALLEICKPIRLEDGVLFLSMANDILKSKLERSLPEFCAYLESRYGQHFAVKIVIGDASQEEVIEYEDDLATFGTQELGGELRDID